MIRESAESDFRRRYLIISLEKPSISWDWFIDPEGQAYDVLEEFKNLRCVTYIDMHRKDRLGFNWPIIYSMWHWSVAYRHLYAFYRKKEDSIFVQRANDRFKRRCEKKAMKLAKAQGILSRGPKMPGAWID